MILEVAILNVKKGQEESFENTFEEAQKIISHMKGYISHNLQKCIENNSRYLLTVNWETLENQKNIWNGKDYYIITMTHFQ